MALFDRYQSQILLKVNVRKEIIEKPGSYLSK